MDSEICHVMLAGHIYKLFVLSCFGHCCKTIFSHLSLMEAQTQFSAQTGMQACSWPSHTSKSRERLHQFNGNSFHTQLWISSIALPIKSSHSTTHAMPVWSQCVFSGTCGEKMAVSLQWGLTPDVHAIVGEKTRYCTSVGVWDRLLYSVDCKDLQHSDQFSAQPFTVVAQKYNSVDWLKCLFKVPPHFTPQ